MCVGSREGDRGATRKKKYTFFTHTHTYTHKRRTRAMLPRRLTLIPWYARKSALAFRECHFLLELAARRRFNDRALLLCARFAVCPPFPKFAAEPFERSSVKKSAAYTSLEKTPRDVFHYACCLYNSGERARRARFRIYCARRERGYALWALTRWMTHSIQQCSV